MKYERFIMLGMLALFYIGVFDVPLSFLTGAIYDGMEWLIELLPIF